MALSKLGSRFLQALGKPQNLYRCKNIAGGPRPWKLGTPKNNACLYSTVTAGIQKSPLKDIEIPNAVPLPRHVMKDFSKYGDLVALVDGVTGRQFTYNELQTAVARVGASLLSRGFQRGDVITIFSPNYPEFVIIYLAVTSIGGIVSAVNPVYTAGELAHALNHSESKLLVTAPVLMDVAREALASCPNIKETIVFGEAEGCRPFDSLLEGDLSLFPQSQDCNTKVDMAALPYSSGTTGLPKGVMLTHYCVLANVIQISTEDTLNYRAGEDVLVGVLPFFHIYGQVVVMLAGLMKGVKLVTLPKFDPKLFLDTIKEHEATYLHVVPPIVLFLAKHPMVQNYDLSRIHTCFTGAAPVGANTITEAIQKMHPNVCFRQGYGLTETSPVTHVNPRTNYRYDTVGIAVHNTEFKIVDINSGAMLGPKEEGELCVRGPQMMKGYFKNDKATADTIKDGWLHTGDIGYFENDGHVIISDRLKELIKVKGLQVAPAELEALLVTHPAIEDAAVIGMPDERAGELPRAYIVLKPNMKATEEEVKKFVEAKVAPYKKLAGGVEFRDSIPKSASGKILRRELKEELKQ